MRIIESSEGILPSLLWRIDEAEQIRGITSSSILVYRADVLRNLNWILNSVAFAEGSSIYMFEHAADSVLNYGLPPTSGRIGSSMEVSVFVEKLRDVIVRFEPRIIPDTLDVASSGESDGENMSAIGFVISGSIWCEPIPERFSLDTRIDPELGGWEFNA